MLKSLSRRHGGVTEALASEGYRVPLTKCEHFVVNINLVANMFSAK